MEEEDLVDPEDGPIGFIVTAEKINDESVDLVFDSFRYLRRELLVCSITFVTSMTLIIIGVFILYLYDKSNVVQRAPDLLTLVFRAFQEPTTNSSDFNPSNKDAVCDFNVVKGCAGFDILELSATIGPIDLPPDSV